MLKRRLSLIAMLACLQAGNLVAQDRIEFGGLPQPGDAAQPLPGGEKYAFGSIAPALPGGANLAPALEVIDQPERRFACAAPARSSSFAGLPPRSP